MIKWWSDIDIEVTEIDGKMIALYGWNGEQYCECWEVTEIVDNIGLSASEERFVARPVYSECNGESEITGYSLTRI